MSAIGGLGAGSGAVEAARVGVGEAGESLAGKVRGLALSVISELEATIGSAREIAVGFSRR